MSVLLPVEADLLFGERPLPVTYVSTTGLSAPADDSCRKNVGTPAFGKRKARCRKPYPCTFASCGKSYVNLLNLQKHQKHHPKLFRCRYMPCSSDFLSIRDRTGHEVLLHGRSKQLVCYLCKSYSSENESYIRAHVSRMHEEVSIVDAMTRIIDGVGPLDKTEVAEEQRLQKPEVPLHKERDDLVCYMCSFSTRKRVNMYQHIWRRHRDSGLNLKEVMAKVINSRTVNLGGKEM